MLFACGIAFVRAVSWIDKPFAGFLSYAEPFRGSFGSVDWPGTQAGLKFLEPIDEVNGLPVSSGEDLVDAVANKLLGTLVQYKIGAEGRTRSLTLPVTLFGIKDFILVFFTTFLGGLSYYILGVIVYILKPNISTSRVFLLAGLFLGIYMATGFEIQSTYSLVRFHYFILGIFPAFWLHLGLVFPEKRQMLVGYPALEYVIYIPALILGTAYLIHFSTLQQKPGFLSWMPNYVELSAITRIYTLFCYLGLIFSVFYSYFRASSIQARQRARLILLGLLLAAAPSAILMALVHFAVIKFYWNFLVFFLIFFPAAIAYSIVKHNLFDADTIIRRTVGYVIVTGVVIGAYVLVSVALNVYLEHYQLAQSREFPILFTLGVILVFNPLRNRIQLLVDRIFFRKEYDYGAIVEKIGNAMASLLDLKHILAFLEKTFTQDMYIDTASIMLLNSNGSAYAVCAAEGDMKAAVEGISFQRNEPLIQIIEKQKKELTKYDLLEDPSYKEMCAECENNFVQLNASLMVPMVYQDQVIGVLNLGDKKSGKFYNREDVDLLRSVAHQAAVAIENARLFQENLEKQRMEEELNFARDLQLSMLPAQCPVADGYQIAATSLPAREVGGDFYDFIEMENGKTGFVIGDVTGKSVSGALVMSAARSVLRMLSEEKFRLGEIMARANRRARKDMRSGMFIALLYAVLDAKNGKLSLCSAGQTQPIHFSAQTGTAGLVETHGDTFPLGILKDADYRETALELSPGDRIVLYTDGIVEAKNLQDELYGFDRLIEVILESRAVDADNLMTEILTSVNSFVGEAPQHDDLTLIVITVENAAKSQVGMKA
jgi:sigma-B regulation protein RsbU (phosphoserine phosphatase)